jgi:hypothetical protein
MIKGALLGAATQQSAIDHGFMASVNHRLLEFRDFVPVFTRI